MEKLTTVAQLVAPILVTIFLGNSARRKQILTPEGVQTIQQFVIRYCIPCLLFNSCLSASIGVESVGTMLALIPLMILTTLWAFGPGKKRFPMHNLPVLFSGQETGSLGIPLFLVLFGAEQVYRMGVLDLAQAVTSISAFGIVASSTGKETDRRAIVKNVLSSPIILMSLLGLGLNLSGLGTWLDGIGIGPIITETTTFLAGPVSMTMIFAVGYNFTLSGGNRNAIVRLSAFHFLWFLVIGGVMQLILFLIPNVDSMTRWAVLLYSVLPASFLAPSLGRTEDEQAISSGVCSILSILCLIIFMGMAIIVA